MSDMRQTAAVVSDRRALRTRRMLWEALLALLQTHDWAEISVQMICDRGDVARSTFYAHFPTKQDLLDAGFAMGAVDVAAEIARLPADPARLAVLAWLVNHTAESQGFMRRVRGSAAGQVILTRFQAMIGTLLARDLEPLGPVTPEDQAFLTGGVFAALDLWLTQGCREPQAMVVARLRRQIDGVLGGQALR
jgi:AcrR family transcriptional regulator